MSLRARHLILALLAPALLMSRAQEAQLQQARQIGVLRGIPATARTAAPTAQLPTAFSSDTESFGFQQFLKEQERRRHFHAFSQITAFVTKNAALTRVDQRRDSFLVASLGLDYRRPLGRGWLFETSIQLAMFRYNEYRVLDFNSLDTGIGVVYHAERLGGIDLFARTSFTALTGTHSAEPFLQSHTVIAGAQKAIAFNPANGIYFGAAAQTSFTDPKTEQRSELAAFAGYRLQATRHVEADALFRYAYIPYAENGRRDHNESLSVGLRYRFSEWFSLYAVGFAGWNQSNIEAFSYEDVKGGGGLTLDVRF